MSDMITTYLGTYDEFEEELVIEILTDHGIYATPKHETTETEGTPYPTILSDRGIILVDATRVDDAKRILDEELPAHLESIRQAMEQLENTPDDQEDEGGD
jgi:hypothetical protein